jgi:L-asparaginase
MLHFLFTGGTISMHKDPLAGGNVPALGGEELLGFAPEIREISSFRIENWDRVPACHLGPERLWALRERVREIAESGQVSGVVVTHGTDTMEETAYLLDRTLEVPVPVVLTGAMRTSSDAGWDGPRNLTHAATVAASKASCGRGTLVVFAGQVFAGRTAVKVHATDLAAFAAPHAGPVGRVSDGEVRYGETSPPPRIAPLAARGLSARVALVPMVVGDQGTLLDLARSGHDGVVIEAFGSGNLPPGALPAIGRWLENGKPVVLATRCFYGEVTPLYAFEGGGARLVSMGVQPAGSRTASQARLELTLALSAGVPYGSA